MTLNSETKHMSRQLFHTDPTSQVVTHNHVIYVCQQLAFSYKIRTVAGGNIFTTGLNWAVAFDLPNHTLRDPHTKRIIPPVILRRQRRELYRRLETAMNSWVLLHFTYTEDNKLPTTARQLILEELIPHLLKNCVHNSQFWTLFRARWIQSTSLTMFLTLSSIPEITKWWSAVTCLECGWCVCLGVCCVNELSWMIVDLNLKYLCLL